jgi:hypothetical protein
VRGKVILSLDAINCKDLIKAKISSFQEREPKIIDEHLYAHAFAKQLRSK